MRTRAFTLLFVIAAFSQFCPATATAQEPAPTQQKQTQEVVAKDTVKIYFEEIHCEGCAKKIRSRIFTLNGVKSVATTVSDNTALINCQPGKTFPLKKLWETLEEGEFEINRIVTSEKTITEKPEV